MLFLGKDFSVWVFSSGWIGILEQGEDFLTTDKGILMQYTGLKDKNGKEIYEGDILRDVDGYIGKVVFSNGAFWVEFLPPYNWDPMLRTCLLNGKEEIANNWEIIGNIYENPELLEVYNVYRN